MKVFTDTNYREHGARDLVEYLDKDRGLQNRFGEQMSDEEIEAFIEQSEDYGFERQIIISPEQGEQLSDRELSHYTRQVMSDFCRDRPTATYCYAIHRDTDHPHTQVAVTGTKQDLWMDREDCLWLRDRATEQFHDQHRELTQEVSEQLENALVQDRDPEQQTERGRENGVEAAPTHERPEELQAQSQAPHQSPDEPDHEQDQSQGHDQEHGP